MQLRCLGRLRNPQTLEAYAPDAQPELLLGRGYTGHEHLPWFGLVNMNARLYDPVLGRFLSPDPYVQLPDFTQSFNRYTHGLNNPLLYTDESGEFLHIIVGAVIGGVINWVAHGAEFSWEGLAAFGVGAGAGALTALTGGVALAAMGGTAAAVGGGGFVAGAVAAGVGYTAGSVVQAVGNHAAFGDPLPTAAQFATGLGLSMLTGRVLQGVNAELHGRNFWSGGIKPVMAPIRPLPQPYMKMESPKLELPKLEMKTLEPLPELRPSATTATTSDKGLLTPNAFAKSLTPEEAQQILTGKYGPPVYSAPDKVVFFNPETGRSFTIHIDPLHGNPHLDINTRMWPKTLNPSGQPWNHQKFEFKK